MTAGPGGINPAALCSALTSMVFGPQDLLIAVAWPALELGLLGILLDDRPHPSEAGSAQIPEAMRGCIRAVTMVLKRSDAS